VEAAGARERLILQADNRLEPLVVARPEAPEAPSEAEETPDPALEETGEVPPPGRDEGEGGWSVRIEQVVLTDRTFFLVDAADPSQPPIEFSLEELRIGDVVLARGQVSVGPVGIRGPRLRVLRGLQIGAAPPPESEEPAAEPETPDEPAAGAAPTDFRLESFAIEGAQLNLLLDDGEFDITLDLSVRDASLARDERFPVELRLSREDGWIELVGKLGLAPIAFDGTLRWEDFPIVGLIAAASPDLPLALHAGSVAGELKIDLESARPGSAEPGRASARGRLAVEQMELRHDDGLVELDCDVLAVVVDEIDVPLSSDEPAKLALGSIRIEKPAVKLVRTAPAPGAAAEAPPAEEASPPAAEPAPGRGGPRIAVGKVEVKDGSFQLLDHSVEPTATTTLSEIHLEGSELALPARSGRLEADIHGLGDLSLQVSGDWREGTGTTTVALQNLHLMRYSPYVASAAGFKFERGSASLDGKIESAGPTHEVDADLTLEKIALEDAEEGGFQRAFGVSAPLAVSLLTDARGNIRLPVDLTLDEGGTSIDLTALFIGAIRQSLGAVLAAPLKGLGLALRTATGGLLEDAGGIELDPLELEPGSAQLTPDQVDHMGLVASGLATRPDIGLVLSGRVGEEDEPFLRAQALLEQIEAGGFAPYDEKGLVERRRLRRGLKRRVDLQPDELTSEDHAVLAEWLAEVEVPRKARDRLAGGRADAVQALMVDTHDVEPAQLRIGEPREGAAGVAIDLFLTSQ
jgi:hypothetical protein